MNIRQTIDAYLSARETELALCRAASGQYNRQAHYQACDETSKWAYRLINHSDFTVELADKYYASASEDIAYPVSC